MKAVLKFIAIHTLFWIAAESLYTRVCHEGFEQFLESCVYFSHSKGNYSESVKVCRSFNPSAWLFVPHDENELEVLKNKIVQVYVDTPRFIRLGIKQPPGLAAAEGWYWGSEIPVYCPENYRLYNGRCFGVHDNDLNFTMAEKQCNKLQGGHLAAFRSQEELDFIKHHGHGSMWIGLTDEGDEGNWTFTDGTTLPEAVTFDEQNGGTNANCGFVYPVVLHDIRCQAKLGYSCMTKAHAGILPNIDDPDENLRHLFDFDTDTCLNVLSTLFKMRRNRLDLIIPQNIEDGLVRAYFSQKVVCEAKKIIYEFKESTECEREYVKSCDLVTTGSGTRTSCEYRCRCEQDGCRIVLIDEFGNQSAEICEISYE